MSELSAEELADLIEQVRESDFSEVRIEVGDLAISISRRQPGTDSPVDAAASEADEPAPTAKTPPPPAAGHGGGTDNGSAADDGTVLLRSPVLGTFYRRPAPDEQPFVEPGSEVGEDTVVGIVEVMKLMNHVTAQTAGRVERVLVEDGQLVEYDQPLLTIRPA